MKQSDKLQKQHTDLRRQLIAEIMLLEKKHVVDLELAVEFPSPIFYGTGIDEQDNAPEIEEITTSGLAIIYHQGMEVERFPLEQLDTDKLIEVLKGMEDSFAEAEKFANKK